MPGTCGCAKTAGRNDNNPDVVVGHFQASIYEIFSFFTWFVCATFFIKNELYNSFGLYFQLSKLRRQSEVPTFKIRTQFRISEFKCFFLTYHVTVGSLSPVNLNNCMWNELCHR